MAENQQNGKKSGVEEDKKLFVGGLTLETTEKDIKDYFEPYGQIVSVTLKLNPTTGKSKGFAFVVFAQAETVDEVLQKAEHEINGKTIDVKKAKAKPGKIFVGGITQEITDEDIKQYFGQYGNITQLEMPFDKTKNQRKPFCFITFDNDSVVKELLKRPKQTIKDKQVDVKKAATQPAQMGRGGFGGGWGAAGGRGGRGGRGGGWGGQGGWDQGGWGGDYGYGGGYDNGYAAGGGYDYYGSGGGYGGGYGMDTSSSYGGGYGGGAPARGGGGGRGGGRGGRGGQRHQPY